MIFSTKRAKVGAITIDDTAYDVLAVRVGDTRQLRESADDPLGMVEFVRSVMPSLPQAVLDQFDYPTVGELVEAIAQLQKEREEARVEDLRRDPLPEGSST